MFDYSPPTFKTSNPQSRTQLKLQLMREQQQEIQRKALQQQQHTDNEPPQSIHPSIPHQHHQQIADITDGHQTLLKVPISSIGIDLPPQVLKVRTALENPTRYHVIEKQKSQVRQYISESFGNVSHNGFFCPPASSTGKQQKLRSSGTAFIQSIQSAPCTIISDDPNDSLCGNSGYAAHIPSDVHSEFLSSHPNESPDTQTVSPSLSSVATSASEVSIFYCLVYKTHPNWPHVRFRQSLVRLFGI